MLVMWTESGLKKLWHCTLPYSLKYFGPGDIRFWDVLVQGSFITRGPMLLSESPTHQVAGITWAQPNALCFTWGCPVNGEHFFGVIFVCLMDHLVDAGCKGWADRWTLVNYIWRHKRNIMPFLSSLLTFFPSFFSWENEKERFFCHLCLPHNAFIQSRTLKNWILKKIKRVVP